MKDKRNFLKPESFRVFLGAFAIVKTFAAFHRRILLIILIVNEDRKSERIPVERIARQFGARVVGHGEIAKRPEKPQFRRN